MKNNSIPDFPLDTTTLNSTEIPELDTQTANQLLNNVLEACDMEPRHFFCQKHLTNRLKFAAKPIEYILFYRLEGDFYVTCVRHESPPGRSAPVRLV